MLKDTQTAKTASPVFTMHQENSSLSYANAFKSSGSSTNSSENSFEFKRCFQALTQNMTNNTQGKNC